MVASAYIIGVSVAVVLLIIAAIVAVCISFRPDNSDVKSRKIWFWVISSLVPILTFAIAFVAIYKGIRVPSRQSAYMTAMCISSAVSFVLYLVLGFVLAKVNSHGKIGNWF